MRNLKEIPTGDLLAYMNIIENLHESTTKAITGLLQILHQEKVPTSEYPDFLDSFKEINKEQKSIFEEIQKEVDRRLVRDLKFDQGIRRSQYVYNKVLDFLHKKEEAAAERAEELHKEVIKMKTENDTSNQS